MLLQGFKKTAMAILLLAVLFSVSRAIGHTQPQPQDGRDQRMAGHLTSEQMQQVKSIREGAKAEAQALQRQIRQKRQALMQYVQSPQADESRAMAMNRELSDLMARVGELRIQTVFRMKEVLPSEQFERFAQRRQQSRERLMDRMQQRRGGGEGDFGGRPRQQRPDRRFGQRLNGEAQDGPRRPWRPQGNAPR